MDILVVGASWLHLLATVVFIGAYVLLALIFTPALIGQLQPAQLQKVVVTVYRRIRPYAGLSLLIFIVTGFYLMTVNSQYTGIGQFNNTWSLVMLVKHVLVLALIAMAFVIQRGPLGVIEKAAPADGSVIMNAAARLRTLESVAMLIGLAVLLLTALAAAA